MYGTKAHAILRGSIYKTGEATPITRGIWSADNLYDGVRGLYIIVRRKGEIVGHAEMNADTLDGVAHIEFANTPGHATKRKVVNTLLAWVEQNKHIYPERG